MRVESTPVLSSLILTASSIRFIINSLECFIIEFPWVDISHHTLEVSGCGIEKKSNKSKDQKNMSAEKGTKDNRS